MLPFQGDEFYWSCNRTICFNVLLAFALFRKILWYFFKHMTNHFETTEVQGKNETKYSGQIRLFSEMIFSTSLALIAMRTALLVQRFIVVSLNALSAPDFNTGANCALESGSTWETIRFTAISAAKKSSTNCRNVSSETYIVLCRYIAFLINWLHIKLSNLFWPGLNYNWCGCLWCITHWTALSWRSHVRLCTSWFIHQWGGYSIYLIRVLCRINRINHKLA